MISEITGTDRVTGYIPPRYIFCGTTETSINTSTKVVTSFGEYSPPDNYTFSNGDRIVIIFKEGAIGSGTGKFSMLGTTYSYRLAFHGAPSDFNACYIQYGKNSVIEFVWYGTIFVAVTDRVGAATSFSIQRIFDIDLYNVQSDSGWADDYGGLVGCPAKDYLLGYASTNWSNKRCLGLIGWNSYSRYAVLYLFYVRMDSTNGSAQFRIGWYNPHTSALGDSAGACVYVLWV